MIRRAILLLDGRRIRTGRPGPGPLSEIAGRPLIEHVILHLAAFGVREILLSCGRVPAALARYDGERLGNALVTVAAAGGPMADDADRPLLVADPAPILADLAALLAPPDAAGVIRILIDGGEPAGFLLLDHETACSAAFRRDPRSIRQMAAEIAAAPGGLDIARAGEGAEALHLIERQLDRPAAFLDRDGVINVDHGYTFRPEELVFTPTAVEGIRLLNRANYRVLVVTNQSGVARGLYGLADVDRFHAHLQDALIARGAHVDGFYLSPYHPEGSVAEFAIDHEDRKPSPGMLLRGMREWAARREGSVMFGDKDSDVEAARRAGIPGIRIAGNVGDLAAAVRAFLGGARG